MLSAGGNDIAGPELVPLLNHKKSGLPPVSEKAVEAVVGDRIGATMGDLLGAVKRFSQIYFKADLPIFVHGYDYLVPDGRGVLGGWGPLPGPWLKPGLLRKGYDDVAEGARIMRRLVDALNETIAAVATRTAGVTYVDLRGTLDTTLPGNLYRKAWGNEIHPTAQGYAQIANVIDSAL